MRRWERRLKDLALLLDHCEETYFDPELFRMNTNQFLQTARTVTFLIQKDKASIPGFDKWYQGHVLGPWASDPRMNWAKNSRNTIEKVGDLELYSSLSATLILGYLDEADFELDVGCEGLVAANIKRLIRFAEKSLPSGVSDGAFVRIERKWVANTLPDWELLTALTYVYSRAKEVCEALAAHLGLALNPEIPNSRDFSSTSSDARAIRYVPLRGREMESITTKSVPFDPNFEPPPKLVALFESRKGKSPPRSFDELMEYHIAMATTNFETYDNHVPMMFMYGDDWRPVDQLTTQFEERADKYIFWRAVGERVLHIKPRAIIWIAETWIRDSPKSPSQRIDSLPIVGEQLQLWGITNSKEVQGYGWDIIRDTETDRPTLGKPESVSATADSGLPNFFAPIVQAFEKLNSGTAE